MFEQNRNAIIRFSLLAMALATGLAAQAASAGVVNGIAPRGELLQDETKAGASQLTEPRGKVGQVPRRGADNE